MLKLTRKTENQKVHYRTHPIHIPTPIRRLWEALAVVWVADLASSGFASSWASPADTTTLSVERSTRGRWGSGGAGRSSSTASGAGAPSGGARVGRTNGTELDVGESDGSIGRVGNEVVWNTTATAALTTLDTRVGLRAVKWVGGVEPQHVGGVVTPDGHD